MNVLSLLVELARSLNWPAAVVLCCLIVNAVWLGRDQWRRHLAG